MFSFSQDDMSEKRLFLQKTIATRIHAFEENKICHAGAQRVGCSVRKRARTNRSNCPKGKDSPALSGRDTAYAQKSRNAEQYARQERRLLFVEKSAGSDAARCGNLFRRFGEHAGMRVRRSISAMRVLQRRRQLSYSQTVFRNISTYHRYIAPNDIGRSNKS